MSFPDYKYLRDRAAAAQPRDHACELVEIGPGVWFCQVHNLPAGEVFEDVKLKPKPRVRSTAKLEAF